MFRKIGFGLSFVSAAVIAIAAAWGAATAPEVITVSPPSCAVVALSAKVVRSPPNANVKIGQIVPTMLPTGSPVTAAQITLTGADAAKFTVTPDRWLAVGAQDLPLMPDGTKATYNVTLNCNP